MLAHVFNYFNYAYNWKNLTFLVIVAAIIRYAVFGFYIQYQERYHQADSVDYHNCALGLALGTGMHRLDTLQPVFWRTPGYPWYLSWFYKFFGVSSGIFSDNAKAQKAAILLQIFLCSFAPLLIFFLSLSLTQILSIAWLTAWISVVHIGFVLASSYLLTDGLAQLFFILFMLFFYRTFVLYKEPEYYSVHLKHIFLSTALAAISLAAYTWMRPHGKFVAVVAGIILLLGACRWKLRFTKVLLFGFIFFIGISGWYIRNYNLTGQWFFCPMSGPILQVFSAPKILRRATGNTLDYCFKYMLYRGSQAADQEINRLQQTNPELVVSKELVCGTVAWPIIKEYPHYFIYEWAKEVIKTTFDLYSSQLVAFTNNSYTYDPLEEHLLEKIALCLYKQPMPWLMRVICWLEFIFSLLIWFALCGGFIVFLCYPLIKHFKVNNIVIKMFFLWLKTGLLIGAVLIMTGGFGYARLRIPIDPLIIILALTFWWWLATKKVVRRKK